MGLMGDDLKRFTLTANHVLLLRRAYVSWDGDEWGAPEINPKRPYGNGDLYDDMAHALGLAAECPNCGHNVLGDNDRARLAALHKETQTALQIVLATGSFEPGEYVSERYGRNWRRSK